MQRAMIKNPSVTEQEENGYNLLEDGNSVEDHKIIIKAAVPLTIIRKDNKADLSWLCIDSNDKKFILTTQYKLSDVERDDFLLFRYIAFAAESKSIADKITDYMIMEDYDNYLCDLQFDLIDNKEFVALAMKIGDNNSDREYFDIVVNPDLFASMSFIDDYLMNINDNIHDLGLASTIGYSCIERNSEVAIISDINYIINMAPIEKKSGNISIVFRSEEQIDATTKNVYSILCPFNVGFKFKSSKFKGDTVDKIMTNYMTDADQYTSELITSVHIKNIDKDYFIILAKNKNNNSKVFLFDSVLKNKLEKMILDY